MWKWFWPRFKQESRDEQLKREFDRVFKDVVQIVIKTDVAEVLMHFSATITHEGVPFHLSLGIAVGPMSKLFDEAVQALRDRQDTTIPLDDIPPSERGR